MTLTAANTDHKRSNARMAGLALLLGFVFNAIGRGVGDTYIVFILPLSAEFGWNRSEISSVYSVYMLATGLSAPFVGMLFDRFGPRVVYSCGLGCLGLAYVTAGSLNHLWQFYLCVGVAGGLGVASLGMVPAASLVSRWFRGNTGTALGVAYAGLGCGTLLIVPLAQYMSVSVGWRDAYHVLGGVLLVLLPFIVLIPWKALWAGPGVGGHTADFSQARKHEAASAKGTLRAAIRTPAFWSLAQVFGFTGLAMYTILVQTIAFLVETGMAPLQAASAYGVAGMLSVGGVMASGALADRIGYRRTVAGSFVFTLIGIASLLGLSHNPSPWLLVTFIGFFGIAQGARGPVVSGLCAKIFPGAGLATIYGVIYACMSMGAATGSLVSGVLHDVTGGYRAGFMFSMVCVVIAIAPFWTSSSLKQAALAMRR
ncbi:MFS transporter [Pusillimonas sp. ANT_WB101]|uniref:MFS transporter n=1 Tax=Pusillimonas sp. ANT_WB101 TaxID=2597356 RepID=UPI0011EDEF0D|nr:MFS transporter [Pusillimonas sp. ANT_WB101]KAA0890938.1 MFS transporter [Pusillimonas sp. ANT_WB101]